jgi:hypothetical protein
LEENRDREPDEHDDDASGDVDHEVVRRRHDRERHRNRKREGRHTHREACHRRHEHDPDEQVPAGVQARERRVLVREARRLQRSVGVGALRDRVDEPDVEQARRRDGEEREKEEADQAGGDHRVAEEVVAPASVEVETRRHAEDHRPVAPDVDPVGGVHEQVAAERDRLECVLPADPERVLERDQVTRVRERRVRVPGGQVAHAEVDEDRERDDERLADGPSTEDGPHRHLLRSVSTRKAGSASAISRSRGP